MTTLIDLNEKKNNETNKEELDIMGPLLTAIAITSIIIVAIMYWVIMV